MVTKIIELSSSNYNGSSSLLSIIVIISFIYFITIVGSNLYNKLNPNAKYKNPNIFNSLIQNTMNTIQYLMSGNVADNIDNKIANYKDDINNLSKTIKESTNFANQIIKLVSALNKKIYDQFAIKLNKFNKFFENVKTTIIKMQSAVDNLNNKYEDLYKNYQIRLQTYVNNLISMMSKISEQITKATVIPSLFNMIAPLKKIYNSIYNTIKTNLPFIRKIYKDDKFDITGSPYDSTAKPNLNTGFNASRSILTIAGYK